MGKIECSIFYHRVSRFKYTYTCTSICTYDLKAKKRLMVEGDLCGGKMGVVGGG